MAANASESRELKHPQESRDRDAVNALLTGEPNDYNLAELARLRSRYRGFPGARDIQANLESVLQRWQLTEDELHEKTRAIHAKGGIYAARTNKPEEQDWS